MAFTKANFRFVARETALWCRWHLWNRERRRLSVSGQIQHQWHIRARSSPSRNPVAGLACLLRFGRKVSQMGRSGSSHPLVVERCEVTTESTPSASVAFERDDIELVKLFLSRYKTAEGNSYTLKARPDVTKRK
jgi:hypothetical protein